MQITNIKYEKDTSLQIPWILKRQSKNTMNTCLNLITEMNQSIERHHVPKR